MNEKTDRFIVHGDRGSRLWIGALLFGLVGLLPVAHASGPVVTFELSSGGDTLASTTDGTELKAGGLLFGSIGFELDLGSENMALRTGIGIKYDDLNATDGEADFIRFPLEAALVARLGSLSLGAGITYHLAPEYEESTNAFGDLTIKFDDALGYQAFLGFALGTGELGVRATVIEYEDKSGFLEPIDGNSIGIYYAVVF